MLKEPAEPSQSVFTLTIQADVLASAFRHHTAWVQVPNLPLIHGVVLRCSLAPVSLGFLIRYISSSNRTHLCTFSVKWVDACSMVVLGKRTMPSGCHLGKTGQNELDESQQHKRIYWGLEG